MEWKSPRKVNEEIRDYKRARFEHWMTKEDNGELVREMAIAALRSEMENIEEVNDSEPWFIRMSPNKKD